MNIRKTFGETNGQEFVSNPFGSCQREPFCSQSLVHTTEDQGVLEGKGQKAYNKPGIIYSLWKKVRSLLVLGGAFSVLDQVQKTLDWPTSHDPFTWSVRMSARIWRGWYRSDKPLHKNKKHQWTYLLHILPRGGLMLEVQSWTGCQIKMNILEHDNDNFTDYALRQGSGFHSVSGTLPLTQ